METRSRTHQTNIERKAQRAVDAIEELANKKIVPDPDFEDDSTVQAMVFLMDRLFLHQNAESAAWWVAVGVTVDLMAGETTYLSAQDVTMHRTTRPAIHKALTDRILELRRAERARLRQLHVDTPIH